MATRTRIRATPAVRRSQIIEQAIALIGERGYYGFTVQELAKRCNLSNPGLLHYFPSKPEVLLAVLAEMEAHEAGVFEPLVQAAERELHGENARSAILDILFAMVERSLAQPAAVRLLAELMAESLNPDHPAHGWWHRREALLLDFLSRLLAPHVLGSEPVARQLMAMIDGLALQWLRSGGGFDVLATWKQAVLRLLPELHPEHVR